MSPAVTETSRSPANARACSTAPRTLSTKVKGAVSVNSQSWGGWWVTTNTWSPAAGTPFQPLVKSKRVRPMTTAPVPVATSVRKSAVGRVTEKTRSSSLNVNGTSPLLYQSNSGPIVLSSYAMKPSSDTAALMITRPIVLPCLS